MCLSPHPCTESSNSSLSAWFQLFHKWMLTEILPRVMEIKDATRVFSPWEFDHAAAAADMAATLKAKQERKQSNSQFHCRILVHDDWVCLPSFPVLWMSFSFYMKILSPVWHRRPNSVCRPLCLVALEFSAKCLEILQTVWTGFGLSLLWGVLHPAWKALVQDFGFMTKNAYLWVSFCSTSGFQGDRLMSTVTQLSLNPSQIKCCNK